MIVWLISICELQTYLIIKENASAAKLRTHARLPKPVLEILPIYGTFLREKTFQKNVVSCFSGCFIEHLSFKQFLQNQLWWSKS